jgi:hypothetical protein
MDLYLMSVVNALVLESMEIKELVKAKWIKMWHHLKWKATKHQD